MKLKLTRQQVIKAIKTEPLKSGAYFHEEYLSSQIYDGNQWIENPEKGKFKNNTGCPVCAVGAILDTSLGKKRSATDLDEIGRFMVGNPTVETLTSNEDHFGTEEFISNGNYVNVKTLIKVAERRVKERPLSSLSSLFEGLMDREEMQTNLGYANYRARRILVNFIKKNFPTKLVIDTKETY